MSHFIHIIYFVIASITKENKYEFKDYGKNDTYYSNLYDQDLGLKFYTTLYIIATNIYGKNYIT